MIRLFVREELTAGCGDILLSREQAHYLATVMRLRTGDKVLVFNGRDAAALTVFVKQVGRGEQGVLAIERVNYQPFEASPDVELVVALVKRGRLETIVEKSAELGARRVRLLTTERTNMDKTNVDRLRSIAIEAAEQTGRLDVPEVIEPEKLARLLARWPAERPLMFCDEAGDAPPALAALAGRGRGPWALLIGPEGGFSPTERTAIRALPAAVPVGLGPRILRADTAAIAALTLWQAALGDLSDA